MDIGRGDAPIFGESSRRYLQFLTVAVDYSLNLGVKCADSTVVLLPVGSVRVRLTFSV